MAELFELACSSVKTRAGFAAVARQPIHHWVAFEHLFKTNYPTDCPQEFVLKYRRRIIELMLDDLEKREAADTNVFRHTGNFTLETFKSGDLLLRAIARIHLPDNEAVKWTPQKLLYCDKKCLIEAVHALFKELPKVKFTEDSYHETDVPKIIKFYIFYYELFKTVELYPVIVRTDIAFLHSRPCIWVKDEETVCYLTKNEEITCDCLEDLLRCTSIPHR